MRSLALGSLVLFAVVTSATAADDSWLQWGRSAQHDSNTSAGGQAMTSIVADVVVDPFAPVEEGGGDLLVHYQVPLIDGDDVFTIRKGGTYHNLGAWDSMTWSVRNLRWSSGSLQERWSHLSDWKPVPLGGPAWEPVYHCAVTANAVWAPGAGGTIDELSRVDGTLVQRFNPFGTTVDPSTYSVGPPAIDAAGNVYYDVIRLSAQRPWQSDVIGAWLVRVAAGGTISSQTFSALAIGAPASSDLCTTAFDTSELPFPPSPDAVPPQTTCGSQRPAVNAAPAVAADGTVYVISRPQFADRWGYLLAVNPDLTPKWAASLHARLSDGCNITIPPNGTPGGCRSGAATGVDPSVNELPSGRVNDDSTSSPVVTPDGKILYGAYTRYNYDEGHLMMFSSDGSFVGAYGWGWDLTPAIYRHDGTWSVLMKENHYEAGSYCNSETYCPFDRTDVTPNDPEEYFITQLSPALQPEWKFLNRNTLSCQRATDGSVQCTSDHPNGFEWCVNAVAVDREGVAYANSEDGNVYAIGQGGILRGNMFLRLALGAAYTPLSIGSDGKIYTQNSGEMFVLAGPQRRRVAP